MASCSSLLLFARRRRWSRASCGSGSGRRRRGIVFDGDVVPRRRPACATFSGDRPLRRRRRSVAGLVARRAERAGRSTAASCSPWPRWCVGSAARGLADARWSARARPARPAAAGRGPPPTGTELPGDPRRSRAEPVRRASRRARWSGCCVVFIGVSRRPPNGRSRTTPPGRLASRRNRSAPPRVHQARSVASPHQGEPREHHQSAARGPGRPRVPRAGRRRPRRRRRVRRPRPPYAPLVAGGAVVGAGAVGGGRRLGRDELPRHRRPAGRGAARPATLAYASIDLDPSGEQKIEALRMLEKFPAFKDELGLDTDDDVREQIFDGDRPSELRGPRLRRRHRALARRPRFAVAAVDTGEEQPSPVVVVQVTDAGRRRGRSGQARRRASGGERRPRGCVDRGRLGGGRRDRGDRPAGRRRDGRRRPSPTTTTYQKWTDEAGDPGIVSMYAAPDGRPGARRADGQRARRPGRVRDLRAPPRTARSRPPSTTPDARGPRGAPQAFEDFEGVAAHRPLRRRRRRGRVRRPTRSSRR